MAGENFLGALADNSGYFKELVRDPRTGKLVPPPQKPVQRMPEMELRKVPKSIWETLTTPTGMNGEFREDPYYKHVWVPKGGPR